MRGLPVNRHDEDVLRTLENNGHILVTIAGCVSPRHNNILPIFFYSKKGVEGEGQYGPFMMAYFFQQLIRIIEETP